MLKGKIITPLDAATSEDLKTKADLVNGKVPAEQLPSYVDDVVEYASLGEFPETGEEGKIYVALDSGFTYRWSGSEYVQIGGQDLSDYYTKSEADQLLDTKQPVGDYATNAALTEGLATKQPIGDYATNTALTEGLATKQDKGDYATNSALNEGLAAKQDKGDYATNSALEAGLATKQPVGDYATNTALTEGLAAKQDVGDYATSSELTSGLATKQNTLVSGTNIKTLNNESLLGEGNIDLASSPMVEITWAELKALRDAGELVPGMQYRITDYQCTTTQSNTSSAGHVFDIIVVADDEGRLNENARAAAHEGDTYFDWNKLEQWRLWYCLDNDENRFKWADTTNGKGVIYRMIDEFNNDVPYDFKNIKFTNQGYTFGKLTQDLSTVQERIIDGKIKIVCYNNTIKPYYTTNPFDYSKMIQTLNKTVIKSSVARDIRVWDNVFGVNNHDNVIGTTDSSSNNGTWWHENKIGADFWGNTIQSGVENIIIGECYSNTIGIGFSNNVIKGTMWSNKISDHFVQNEIGMGFGGNTIGNAFRYNITGHQFYNQKTGEYVENNIFLGNNSLNTIPSYSNYIVLDRGVKYLNITTSDPVSSSNKIQNIHVHSGVQGSSSSDLKTVELPTNLPYETDVYQDESGNLIYKKNNDEEELSYQVAIDILNSVLMPAGTVVENNNVTLPESATVTDHNINL